MADIFFKNTKIASGSYWKLVGIKNVAPQDRSRLSLELQEYQAMAGDIGEPEMAERSMAKIRASLQKAGHVVHMQESAAAIVARLLETDDMDAKSFIGRSDFDRSSNKAAIHMPMYDVDGASRRGGADWPQGEGFDDQWEIPYKDWLFVLSVYEDGTQIWSAHYKTKIYSWSDEKDRARGYSLSGGSDPKQLPAGSDPRIYLARLKKMADLHPAADIWKSRRIPYMPDPAGPDQYRGNY